MTTLSFPRVSTAKQRALRLPQPFVAQTAQYMRVWEEILAEESVAARPLGDEYLTDSVPEVTPLAWRHCAALMFLGSAACYGLGFLVAAGFHHLLGLLQP